MSAPTIAGTENQPITSLSFVWLFGGIAVLLQVALATRYGYFRDELYFLACSDHLAAGYVDLAPLSVWLLHINRVLFGDSLHALRLLPAFAFGAEVVLSGYMARELGARPWGVFLCCVSVMSVPVFASQANRYSMNAFEPLFWMGCIYVLLLVLNRQKPRLLLWCGVLLGLGLENKHSTVFFLGALLIGLLLTPQRRLFASKWLWVAAAIALVMAVPNLLWQVQHHFPTLEDLRNVKAMHKNIELPPLPFIGAQLIMLDPLHALIWLPGLGFLLCHHEAQPFRFLGFTYLAFLAVMMALHGKDYYLAPIYPMLFAAGAVLWEKFSESRPRFRWLRTTLPVTVIVSGIFAAPYALPILSPDRFIAYREALGIRPSRTEASMSGPLPEHFGDEFGWPEMVGAVAGVYNSLPPEQRSRTAILGGNYGEAAAIDFFGPRYGLPKAISPHQNYYYWGPRAYTGESVILLGWNLDDARYWCGTVEKGPENAPYYGMGWEHYTILVCRDFKIPLYQAWPRLKFWN